MSRIPPFDPKETFGHVPPRLRMLTNESNAQDERITAIEEAIARIDAALAHFSKEVK